MLSKNHLELIGDEVYDNLPPSVSHKIQAIIISYDPKVGFTLPDSENNDALFLVVNYSDDEEGVETLNVLLGTKRGLQRINTQHLFYLPKDPIVQFTIELHQRFFYIAWRYVEPSFRNQGILKQVTSAIVSNLRNACEFYNIESNPINIATYKSFMPFTRKITENLLTSSILWQNVKTSDLLEVNKCGDIKYHDRRTPLISMFIKDYWRLLTLHHPQQPEGQIMVFLAIIGHRNHYLELQKNETYLADKSDCLQRLK